MKYDLIFYIAKKTSYCEKALKKALAPIGAELHAVTDAVSPTALGGEVGHSLKTCPLAVIIGGLSSGYDDNLATVLSRVFSNSTLTLDNMRKISASTGEVGYIIRCKSQILLALPDSPEAIEEICSEKLLKYIEEKLTAEEKPSTDESAE